MAENTSPIEETKELAAVEIPGVVDETAAESNESGEGLVEYGLIIFLVAIVVIAVLLRRSPHW